jgi:hypothetical protein
MAWPLQDWIAGEDLADAAVALGLLPARLE